MKLFVVVLLFSVISLNESTEEEDALLLLYFSGRQMDDMNSENNLAFNDSIENLDEITEKGKENDETTLLPDLNIKLPEDEDWIWYPQENSDTAMNNNDQLNTIDNEQMMNDIYNEVIEIFNDNSTKGSGNQKKRKISQISSKNKDSNYEQNALFYILSRLCYEIMILKKKIKQTKFGNLIYGDDKKEFRKKFGIEENLSKKGKYSRLSNYFNLNKGTELRKQCLENITEAMAIENMKYWESEAKNHPDFEELKKMTDILFETYEMKSSKEAAIHYILSKLSHQKKFGVKENLFRKRRYTNLLNRKNTKKAKKEKQFSENISEAIADENMKYWEAEAKKHPDFEELKNLTVKILKNYEQTLRGDVAIYYILSKLSHQKKMKKKEANDTELFNKIFSGDKK